MPALSSHPTIYSGLTSAELYSYYRQEVFSKLSESELQNLFQETANRVAAERGMIGSPEVNISHLDGRVYGTSQGGKIAVSHALAVDRALPDVDADGKDCTINVKDANWQALNTIIHETEHAWQDQVIDGTIAADPAATLSFQSNNNINVAVENNGAFSLGDAYVNGNSVDGYFIYYFQPTEENAHKYAEEKTNEIINSITQLYGHEKSISAYQDSLNSEGYAAMRAQGALIFNNENFAADIRNSMVNTHLINQDPQLLQDKDKLLPVDPAMDGRVKAEMIASREARIYAALQNLPAPDKNSADDVAKKAGNEPINASSHKGSLHEAGSSQGTVSQSNTSLNKGTGGNTMDYTAMTPAEYSAMLHNSVNAYYTHALNDSSMTKEEAINSTSQMAERALTAAEEYTAQYNADHGISSISNTTGSVSSGSAYTGILDNSNSGASVSGSSNSVAADNSPPGHEGPNDSGPDNGGPDSGGPDSGGPGGGGPDYDGPDSGGPDDGGIQ